VTRHLELRHLRLVKAIARHGTMTRAAGELALTQSALSQQLLELEARLGVQLFLRTGRRMVATEAGEGLLIHGERILGEVAALDTWLDSLQHGEVGTLRVSTDSILSLRWLPGAMQRLRARYPRVSVQIGRHGDLLAELADGKLDIGITFRAPCRRTSSSSRCSTTSCSACCRATTRCAPTRCSMSASCRGRT
jgi:LysR family transcriptional regulator, regulator for metE and metH